MRTLFLKLARSTGLFALSRWLTRGQLRILCYHGIWIGPPPHFGDCLFMSADTFAKRMALIDALGYRVISLAEAVERHLQGRSSARDIVITIDDAWLGTWQEMVPVLERHRFPATLYVTTYYTLAEKPVLNVMLAYLLERARQPAPWAEWLGEAAASMDADQRRAALVAKVEALPTLNERHTEVQRMGRQLGVDMKALEDSGTFRLMTASQVHEAQAHGIDIQLHTHTHRMHDYQPEQIAGEVRLNRDRLSQICAVAPDQFRHFCYPSGEYHPRIFPALRSEGVISATTTEFGLNPAGTEVLALKRILDCESFSALEIEARLCGFWSIVSGLRQGLRKWLKPRAGQVAVTDQA